MCVSDLSVCDLYVYVCVWLSVCVLTDNGDWGKRMVFKILQFTIFICGYKDKYQNVVTGYASFIEWLLLAPWLPKYELTKDKNNTHNNMDGEKPRWPQWYTAIKINSRQHWIVSPLLGQTELLP